MQSSIVATLWEQWRLTRAEVGIRLLGGIVAASAILALPGERATEAYFALLMVHCMFWLSLAKLNGGRVIDGYKPGFPLRHLYTRPIPTFAFVGVAMAYDAILCTALYLVSAVLLGIVFDVSLPLFSVALWLITFHLISTCIQWSSANRVVQWAGSFAICLPLFWMLRSHRLSSPLRVEFSLGDNVLMALLCVVAVIIAVAGAAQQRRGESRTDPPTARTVSYPEWLVSLFKFPCPTSSPTRAQVWFELKSSGLPILAIGLSVATLIAILFALAIPFAPIRSLAGSIALLSVPAVLLFLAGNAFSVRHKGRTYLNTFEATQPYGVAKLAVLKVITKSSCVLLALVSTGASIATSSSLAHRWGALLVDGQDTLPAWLKIGREIADALVSDTSYEYAAQALVFAIVVALIVAVRATITALRARYPRGVTTAIAILLLGALLLVALAPRGIVSPEEVKHFKNWINAVLQVLFWLAAAATAYILWTSLTDRLVTWRYVTSAVAIASLFATACLTLIGVPEMQSDLASMMHLDQWLPQALVAFMLSIVVPWSYSRIRHT